ncbi:MAG: zf-TFIIB domain-containing protein [Victivallales bacterium]|nr:zf-TFIIB domain-containing protein [Victivallales bacterium]
MICPECNEEMLVIELDGVEIDLCDTCRGVWLDEGEIELLAGLDESSDEPFVKALRDRGAEKRTGNRKCPVCSKAMIIVEVPLDPPVEIDRCPANHGLWFDHGELDAVVAAAKNTEVGGFLNKIFGADTQT